ncbi:hypothetical protein DESC_820035 [Desulfosarcina cetonica]|uniref:hypothetical protein n=1 Tax=Desulfosarcina cetonica TaxID=90730 RepID=UPI0006D2690B|nr:hypothetical protein [Desulfosarcina cetonica]VTR70675.1 hypothetical protein DESC_820035 [Desulfosarcina cetonica]
MLRKKMFNKDYENVSISKANFLPLFVLFVSIFCIWILSGISILFFIPDWNVRGIFGDMFGAINSLFAGLALGGIIYTIMLQRKELELQRHELELSRSEMKRSADAQEQLHKASIYQANIMKHTARLNALTNVIEVYSDELRYIHKRINDGSDLEDKYNFLQNKRSEAIKMVGEVQKKLMNMSNN